MIHVSNIAYQEGSAVLAYHGQANGLSDTWLQTAVQVKYNHHLAYTMNLSSNVSLAQKKRVEASRKILLHRKQVTQV